MNRLKIIRAVWVCLVTITLVACHSSYTKSNTPIINDSKKHNNNVSLNKEQRDLFDFIDYFSNTYPYNIDKIESDLNTKFSVTEDDFIEEKILTPDSNTVNSLNINSMGLRDIDTYGQVLNIKFENYVDIPTDTFIEIVNNDGYEFQGLFSTEHLLSAVSKTTYYNNKKKEVWIVFNSSDDVTKVVELTFWSPKR